MSTVGTLLGQFPYVRFGPGPAALVLLANRVATRPSAADAGGHGIRKHHSRWLEDNVAAFLAHPSEGR